MSDAVVSNRKPEQANRNLSLHPWLIASGLLLSCRFSCSVSGFAALRALIYTFFSTSDAVMDVTDRTGALIFHAQAYIPAESPAPLEDPRVSRPYEDQERPRGPLTPPRQRP